MRFCTLLTEEESPDMAKKILHGILWFLNHFEELIATLLLAVTFITFGLQIIFRFLGIPASVFSEIYQYAFLVSLMFGISYANRHDEHIRADIVTSHLGPKGKFICAIAGDIVTILFSLGLAVYGSMLVQTMLAFPQQLPILKIPYWIVYIMLPISSVLSCIRVVQTRFDKIKAIRSGDTGLEQIEE